MAISFELPTEVERHLREKHFRFRPGCEGIGTGRALSSRKAQPSRIGHGFGARPVGVGRRAEGTPCYGRFDDGRGIR